MGVGSFWGGALLLGATLVACSSMKSLIVGDSEPEGGEAKSELTSVTAATKSAETAPAATQSTSTAQASAPAAPQAPLVSGAVPVTPVEGIPVKPLSKKELENDAKRDFERATELLKGGQESQALVSFTDFLRRYPEHKLVGDAQFFIGEIFYRQRKFAEALREFSKVKDLLKGESQKTPDAFLKIGECHLKLGQTDRARIEWNAVKRRFAGTAAALQADIFLKGLPR